MAGASASSSGGGFSHIQLEKKLRELNTSLQSIQSVSNWIIHNRKQAKLVVAVWYKDLQKADTSRKLTLMYLANDVIQNSKRKGLEYKLEFTRALPRAFQLVSKEKDQTLQKAVERILNVWEERNVFEQASLTRFKTILATGSIHPHRRTKSESDARKLAPSVTKKVKTSSPDLSPREAPPNDLEPPEAEELLHRLVAVDGDKSVARDLETRQKIASFPPEIHDPDLLAEVKDRAEVEKLAGRIEDASKVLKNFNARLAAECKEREELQQLLDAFIWQQKGLLKDAKKQLKEHETKLERVTVVREELKSHLASLPDLPRGVVSSLAPLPTVGELFN